MRSAFRAAALVKVRHRSICPFPQQQPQHARGQDWFVPAEADSAA